MGESITLRVDVSMIPALEEVRKTAAVQIKKLFNLEEITILGTLASQIMAAHYLRKAPIEFKIKKTGRSKGIIEFT